MSHPSQHRDELCPADGVPIAKDSRRCAVHETLFRGGLNDRDGPAGFGYIPIASGGLSGNGRQHQGQHNR